jgi:hypothetical protein
MSASAEDHTVTPTSFATDPSHGARQAARNPLTFGRSCCDISALGRKRQFDRPRLNSRNRGSAVVDRS